MPTIIDWRQAVWGFAVAVAYCPGILPCATIPRWGMVMLGLGFFRPRLRDMDLCVRLLLCAGYACATASVWMIPDRLTAINDLMFLAVLICVSIVASSWVRIDDVILGMTTGIGVSGLVGFAQLAGWDAIQQGAVPAGLFFNRDIMGELAALLFVWWICQRQYALALVAEVPLAMSLSRVGIIVAIFGALWWWCCGKWRRCTVAGVAICAVGVVLLFFVDPDKVGSAESRMNVWYLTTKLIGWWGNGIGFYHAIVPLGHLVHSDFLQMAGELGFIGIFPFVLIPAVLFLRGWDDGSIWSAEWALFMAFLLTAAVSFPLHLPASGFLGAMLAGFLARKRFSVPYVRDFGRNTVQQGVYGWPA